VILPSSLQSLAFGDRFNQSLERVILQLEFWLRFEQKPGAGDFAIACSKLEFWL
jgi:hypothetical protein